MREREVGRVEGTREYLSGCESWRRKGNESEKGRRVVEVLRDGTGESVGEGTGVDKVLAD